MNSNKVFGSLVVGVAVILLALGLYTVGGPMKGQEESRDIARLQDLYDLQSYAVCVADTEGRVLPASLGEDGSCARPVQLFDRFTGDPYIYEKRSETAFVVCAEFEDAGWVSAYRDDKVAPETGCLHFTYKP